MTRHPRKSPVRRSRAGNKSITYGGGHFTRQGENVWVYTLTGVPVPGAIDLDLGQGRIIMWAPELEPDALLTHIDAAEIVGVKPESWRSMRSKLNAPEPCWHIGASPIWTRGVIEQWMTLRPGRGRKWATYGGAPFETQG